MHTLFVITAEMDLDTLTQQHLLGLAMLNFDHQVSVVFKGEVFETIKQHADQFKQWQGLAFYGADLWCLDSNTNQSLSDTTTKDLSVADFFRLKNQADFIS